MSTLNSDLDRYLKICNEQLRKNAILGKVSESFGVSPTILLIGCLAALLALGAEFLGTFLALVYPCYNSYRAVKQEDAKTISRWLVYWIVFGLFSLFELLFDPFLQLVPFFSIFKLGFLGWMFWPHATGAKLVFEQVVDPVMMKHGRNLDKLFS